MVKVSNIKNLDRDDFIKFIETKICKKCIHNHYSINPLQYCKLEWNINPFPMNFICESFVSLENDFNPNIEIQASVVRNQSNELQMVLDSC